MKRTLFLLVAAMLTLAAVAAAQSQDPNQTAPSSADMNQQSTTPAQTPTDQPTTSTDQSTTSSDLPKTASPLPLMGLSGLASIAAGAWLARPRRKA